MVYLRLKNKVNNRFNENLDKILEKLQCLEEDEDLDQVFLTRVDIEKGLNIFVAHGNQERFKRKLLM